MTTEATDSGRLLGTTPFPGASNMVQMIRPWLGPAFGIIGLATALLTALGPLRVEPAGREDGIALVDGRAIPRATYERALAALEADKRNPVTIADRRLALSRLIDEELLVRRALDLGLAEAEPSARKALVEAMLQLASVPAGRGDPDERELRRYYEERPMLFAGEPLLTIAMAFHPLAGKEQSGRMASLLRAGVAFEKAAAETGAELAAAPPELLSARKLADYLGPGIADAARQLAAGEAVGPIEVAGRSLFVLMRERREGPRPPFESIREQVLEAWQRTARDRALETYLAGLRNRAHITFASDAPR
jgi:hypothetical protein